MKQEVFDQVIKILIDIEKKLKDLALLELGCPS